MAACLPRLPLTDGIAVINPIRYRGYFYDTETGLYYLNSRYYDPETCRFLNGDAFLNANGDLVGYNMFAYCGNNPVNRWDQTGHWWEWVKNVLSTIAGVAQKCLEYCATGLESSAAGMGGDLVIQGGGTYVRATNRLAEGIGAVAAPIIVDVIWNDTPVGSWVKEGATNIANGVKEGAKWVGNKISDGWNSFCSLFS